MTLLAPAVPVNAIVAKGARRAMLGIVAMLTVSVGVSLGAVCSELGQAPLAKGLIQTSDQHRANGDH